MADKPRKRALTRQRAKKASTLAEVGRRFVEHLDARQLTIALASAAVITLLITNFEFQPIPDYRAGDIAHRTVKALQDFNIEDQGATESQRQEASRGVPVVFDYDPRVGTRIEAELRNAFESGRKRVEELRGELALESEQPLPPDALDRIRELFKSDLPGPQLESLPRQLAESGFPGPLEEELVQLVRSVLEYPGVAITRDLLVRYQDRGITVRNSVTGQSRSLIEVDQVRELREAHQILSQGQPALVSAPLSARSDLVQMLQSWLSPNLNFNETLTREAESAAHDAVAPVLIQIKKGRAIVRAGDEVNERTLRLLQAIRERKEPGRLAGRLTGLFLLTVFFQFAVWRYVIIARRRMRGHVDYFALFVVVQAGSLALIKGQLVLIDLISIGAGFQDLHQTSLLYFLAPFSLGAIMLVLLANVHIAILFSLVSSISVGLMTGDTGLFVYSLAGCLAGAFLLEPYRERSAIVKTGMVIAIVNVLTVASVQLTMGPDQFGWERLAWCLGLGAGSALLAAMLASLCLPLLESVFGVTTDLRLLELSNLNSPVLKRLAVEAPGTYHHSIVVGTLAEAAAEAIGANTLLARVGAYYHDIGKLTHPDYYVENQIYCGNKHESLSPSMSSLILASHVKDGLAMADEIKLASEVRDMIPQHHGTKLMTFFYRKALESAGEKGSVDEDRFRYPGPKPQTKESAILMLADQVEAASRTLQNPQPEQIQGLIKRLTQSTVEDGQFDECEITVNDLHRIGRAFERILTGMYHQRIEYPGFEFERRSENASIGSQRVQ